MPTDIFLAAFCLSTLPITIVLLATCVRGSLTSFVASFLLIIAVPFAVIVLYFTYAD